MSSTSPNDYEQQIRDNCRRYVGTDVPPRIVWEVKVINDGNNGKEILAAQGSTVQEAYTRLHNASFQLLVKVDGPGYSEQARHEESSEEATLREQDKTILAVPDIGGASPDGFKEFLWSDGSESNNFWRETTDTAPSTAIPSPTTEVLSPSSPSRMGMYQTFEAMNPECSVVPASANVLPLLERSDGSTMSMRHLPQQHYLSAGHPVPVQASWTGRPPVYYPSSMVPMPPMLLITSQGIYSSGNIYPALYHFSPAGYQHAG